MKGLFKKLGQGIMFIFVAPFWLVAFLLFTLFSIFVFLFTLISAIPAYFRGESILAPSEIDIAASTKIAEQKRMAQIPDAPIFQTQPQEQPNIVVNISPSVLRPTKQTNYIEHDGTIYRKVTEQVPLLSEEDLKRVGGDE